MIKAIDKIPKEMLRDLKGWKDAPVPLCMGGDYRAIAWCCKPGLPLTYGYKCKRDQTLKEIGMSSEEFIRIKEEFSEKHNWDSDFTCYGSLSYCCMRQGGCHRRDPALLQRYPGMEFSEILAIYYALKKDLAQLLLKNAKNHQIVQDYLEHIN